MSIAAKKVVQLLEDTTTVESDSLLKRQVSLSNSEDLHRLLDWLGYPIKAEADREWLEDWVLWVLESEE